MGSNQESYNRKKLVPVIARIPKTTTMVNSNKNALRIAAVIITVVVAAVVVVVVVVVVVTTIDYCFVVRLMRKKNSHHNNSTGFRWPRLRLALALRVITLFQLELRAGWGIQGSWQQEECTAGTDPLQGSAWGFL